MSTIARVLPPMALVLLLGATGACVSAATSDEGVQLVDTPPIDTKADSAAATANGLTAAQAKTVLRVIDGVCGDTWCDGDLNYKFLKMVCKFDKQTCTMTTLVIGLAPATGGKIPTYWRSCKMNGIASYDAMVKTYTTGYQALADGFYPIVDACMVKIAGSVPPQ